MITREEFKTYLRLKEKVDSKDKNTQTEETSTNIENNTHNKIVIINPKNIFINKNKFDTTTYEEDDEDENEVDKNDSYHKLSSDYTENDYSSSDESKDEETLSKSDSYSERSVLTTNKNDDYDYNPESDRTNIKRTYESIEKNYTDDELKFFKKLKTNDKNSIIRIEKNIRKCNNLSTPLRFKILQSDMDLNLKAHAIHKLDSLYNIDPSSSEYNKLMNYIESLAKIPINKYKNLPCNKNSSIDEIASFINNTKTKLDNAVYGHKETKNQIIRLLAQWISNPKSNGLVIGLEGHPGVGKTCLIKNGVSNALDLPFGFVSLGGTSDSSYLTGHSYTYEGSKYGKIAEIIMKSHYMNPVLFFDELDKVSTTRYGDEIISLLIHLTDSSQNDHFQDKYFSEIPLDLSKCLIIFSYNDVNLINPILRDRMITIKIDDYTINDKINIAKNYMIPELLNKYAFDKDDIKFSDDILKNIINQTDKEKGVRNFKRSIDEILSRINLSKLLSISIFDENISQKIDFPITINNEIVSKLLSKKRHDSIDVSIKHIYT